MAITQTISVFLAVSLLFFSLLFIKEKTRRQFCVICASISSAWLIFLALHFLGYFKDMIILGILMGQSITGIYYFAEKKTKEKLHLFRLPFLLTLTLVVYAVIGNQNEISSIIIFVIVLWVIFAGLYGYRNRGSVGKFSKKIIECCKNW